MYSKIGHKAAIVRYAYGNIGLEVSSKRGIDGYFIESEWGF
jgi:hypothetical protein